MLNPTSLFVACLLTLAANPSLVSSIPLPALPHRSQTSFLRHRPSRHARKLPILRIVDDDRSTEPVSWTEAFTEDSILPESIFASGNDFGSSLNLELASVHHSHLLRRDLPPPRSQRVGTTIKSSSTKSTKKTKRSIDATLHKNDKRFSSRWLSGQEAAAGRAAAAKASSTSSTVWTRVSRTSPTITKPTSTSVVVSVPVTASTTVTAPAPTETSLSGTHIGEGTWFAPGLGACGTVATDDSPIVAVSKLLYDTYPGATVNPNLNPICGQRIRATYQGKSVEVRVQDRCEGCAKWDLDFSPTLFGQLADLGIGRLKGVEWTFI